MWLGWGGRGGWCGIHFELGKLQPVFLSLVRDVRITRVGCSQCFFMFFLRSSKQLTVGVQTPLHVAEMISFGSQLCLPTPSVWFSIRYL